MPRPCPVSHAMPPSKDVFVERFGNLYQRFVRSCCGRRMEELMATFLRSDAGSKHASFIVPRIGAGICWPFFILFTCVFVSSELQAQPSSSLVETVPRTFGNVGAKRLTDRTIDTLSHSRFRKALASASDARGVSAALAAVGGIGGIAERIRLSITIWKACLA